MNIEKKVTNKPCAQMIGIGLDTLWGVRKMLGLSGVRKVFPSHIAGFLQRYPDFQLKDAKDRAAMLAFQIRHPDFKLPPAPDK